MSVDDVLEWLAHKLADAEEERDSYKAQVAEEEKLGGTWMLRAQQARKELAAVEKERDEWMQEAERCVHNMGVAERERDEWKAKAEAKPVREMGGE